MKDWFPFTLFDFFSYVACGLTVLCAADYAYPGSNYLMKEKWSAFQGALGLSLAYVCGQLLAIPSSILLEHMIARKLLRPPAVVLLSNRSLKKEKILNFLIGRHYASLPESIRDLVFRNASEATRQTVEMLKENLEAVFVPALLYSRQNERISERIELFRIQYVFARNMCAASIISTFFLSYAYLNNEPQAGAWLVIAILAIFGLFLRFFKFYCCCAADTLRSYAFK